MLHLDYNKVLRLIINQHCSERHL